MKNVRMGLLACAVTLVGTAALWASARAVEWDQKDPARGVFAELQMSTRNNPGLLGVEIILVHQRHDRRHRDRGRPGNPWWGRSPWRRYPDPWPRPPYRQYRVIGCHSSGYYNTCYTGMHYIREIHVQPLSNLPCIPDVTFGLNGAFIWVDRGCSANFHIYGD